MLDELDRYNVNWDTPSNSSAGSMPLGNGDISANVWAVEGGDIVLYIGKTDTWSELGRLLKLGRIRIRLSPNQIRPEFPFSQTLFLRRGEIEIRTGPDDTPTYIKVRVDANNPVVFIEAACDEPFELQVSLEIWRTKEFESSGDNPYSLWARGQSPPHPSMESQHPFTESADIVLEADENRLVWFHHNKSSICEYSLRQQGLEDLTEQLADPLTNLIFGCVIEGDGLKARDSYTLVSEDSRKRYEVCIYPLTSQTPNSEGWLGCLDKNIQKIKKADSDILYSEHCKWWENFWDRSGIFVSGCEDAETVTEIYTLQRFIIACAGRGKYPIKFNGSILNVDNDRGTGFNADYRRWGEPYWEQNTRLIYYAMLASGDFEMMLPFMRMYVDALPVAKARTRFFYDHDGAYFPETIYFWGAYPCKDYGWNREGLDKSWIVNRYTRWMWNGNTEVLAMALDYFTHTEDIEFLSSVALPLADEFITFFDLHFPRDANGRLRIEPAQALETYWSVINPSCEIAGLMWVLEQLLSLPDELIGTERREKWTRLQQELPPLPMGERDGKKVIAVAEEILEHGHNAENPELYAVFPYRLFSIGRPDFEIGLSTFIARKYDVCRGWHQNDIWAAYVGRMKEARDHIVKRFSERSPDIRFPAFWKTGDWIPGQCHGSAGMIALQRMLLQADGDKIFLFPAWPKDWDVRFKLHAPQNTTVEGVFRNGRLESLKVTPESRAKDLVVMEPQ